MAVNLGDDADTIDGLGASGGRGVTWREVTTKIRLQTVFVLSFCGLVALETGLQQHPGQLELIFLDVGQGDAIVVRSPEGKVALLDAGPGADILTLLREHGIDTIDIAIASHAHADHIGGMERVLRSMPVRYYMDNGVPHTTDTYLSLMRTVQSPASPTSKQRIVPSVSEA